MDSELSVERLEKGDGRWVLMDGKAASIVKSKTQSCEILRDGSPQAL
jgi:hypothetical protein